LYSQDAHALFTKDPIDRRRGTSGPLGQDMTVGVSCEPDRGVAQQLHDRAKLLSLIDEERRERMAQLVKAKPRQAAISAHPIEGSVDVAWFEWRADGAGEYEVVWLPQFARRQSIPGLPNPLPFQRL
jgi:hypothetical protein